MPSTSKKQHNFMTAIAHSPAFAKKVGVPMSVGKDFTKADKGRKFKDGGMAHTDIKEDKKLIKRAFKMHDAQEHKGEHTNLSKLKKGGIAMKKTFKDMEKREVEFMRKKGAPTSMVKHEKKEMSEEQGEPMCGGGKVKKMAAGGLSSGHKSANGVATKGKTKGMQVSMPGNKGLKKGGMAKAKK